MYFLIVVILYKKGFVSYKVFNIFSSYSNSLFLFNLMPVYPLDGGRILNILFNAFAPLKRGNKMVIFISLNIILIFCLYNINYNKALMLILIVFELIKYYKDQNKIYNKFLLERYLYNYKHNKYKVIKNSNNIYKEKNNIIHYQGHYITEKSYLNKRYGG